MTVVFRDDGRAKVSRTDSLINTSLDSEIFDSRSVGLSRGMGEVMRIGIPCM